MAEGDNKGAGGEKTPPASDKQQPKPSQFPKPTMQEFHGSIDPPNENTLNLSQNRSRKKK